MSVYGVRIKALFTYKINGGYEVIEAEMGCQIEAGDAEKAMGLAKSLMNSRVVDHDCCEIREIHIEENP